MSQDTIQQFIDAMRAAGLGPASGTEIIPDNEGHDYRIEGDPSNKKKGNYILAIRGEFAFGSFKDWRTNTHTGWNSTTKSNLTEEQKRLWDIEAAKFQRETEEKRKTKYAAAATLAKLEWDKSTPADPTHPYLLKKGLDGEWARQNADGDLLIQLTSNGRMWSYQRITPDCDKLFLAGAKTKGCYCAMTNRDEDKSIIVICEGWATGRAIRKATGLPTIAAMNAANIRPVIEDLKEKYPDSKFIIAADNDQWVWDRAAKTKQFPDGLDTDAIPGDDQRWEVWREAGYLNNPGRKGAEQAAGAINGAYIVYPDFPPNDPLKRTDFDDLHRAEGDDKLREIIKVPQNAIKKHEPKDLNWESGMLVKSVDKFDVKTYKEVSFNYSHAIKNMPSLQGVVAYDEFHLTLQMMKPPPWVIERGEENQFNVHELDDADYREFDYWLQRMYGWKGSVEKVMGAVADAAFKNRRNPAKEYFDSLVWDRIPRLDEWAIKYLSCTYDDPDYVRAVSRTWIKAVVKRIYHPGCKFDHMLILEGPQGAGKSTVFRELATFGQGVNARDYFLDSLNLKNTDNKDELMKLSGKIIVEIQEMAAFRTRDYEELKSFITTQEDTYREPYGRKMRKWPRQFLLGGTYNPVEGIFTDPTGLRRFWVLKCGKIDLEGLRLNKEQIYAEAVHAFKQDDSLLLSSEIYRKAEIAANERRIEDVMRMEVLNAVDGRHTFETRDIMKAMGIEIKGRTQRESAQIGMILHQEGYVRYHTSFKGKAVWMWKKAGVPEQTEIEYEEEIEIPFE